jgi:hypothetical protein
MNGLNLSRNIEHSEKTCVYFFSPSRQISGEQIICIMTASSFLIRLVNLLSNALYSRYYKRL